MAKKLLKILVVDIESTCWKGYPPQEQISEIIQIGTIWYHLDGKKTGQSSFLIRPQYSEISEFCTELTSLTTEKLSAQPTFQETINVLRTHWPCLQDYVWASFGDYDRIIMEKMCIFCKIKNPFGRTHINVKNLFALRHRLKREVGMMKALEILGISHEGVHHDAYYDVLNISRILEKSL